MVSVFQQSSDCHLFIFDNFRFVALTCSVNSNVGYVNALTSSETNRLAIEKAQAGRLDDALELFEQTILYVKPFPFLFFDK
jgi:hypothetical protein